MKMTDIWTLYEADKRILGFSPHTLKAYSLQFKVLTREIGNLNIGEVTLDLLKEYLAKQSERLRTSSLGHRIRFIRSLCRFSFEEGHIIKNPTAKLREPKLEKRILKFLIEEDVINLKITCDSLRERALLEFLYCTGCRVGEIHRLDIEAINWESCAAIVHGKGSKQREVYFTTECKVWLKRYLKSREDSCKALFVTASFPVRRMAIPTIRYALKKLAARGEVAVNVYPHRFRHTYACHLLDNGAPLDFIQGMLGHEKASTTQRSTLNYEGNVDGNYIGGTFKGSGSHWAVMFNKGVQILIKTFSQNACPSSWTSYCIRYTIIKFD